MKTNYETVSGVVRVPLDNQCFGDFYVLIVPDPNRGTQNHYLMHDRSGVVVFMFGTQCTDIEEAAGIAHWSGPEYIAEFVKQHFAEEE